EVRPHGWFAAADVDVEHLHSLELVDDAPALGGGELPRVAASGARQAVHAGQVAGVGQLPGQADRRVEPVPELLDQGTRAAANRGGDPPSPPVSNRHAAVLPQII